MSFGWFLLINGIVGVVIFYGTFIPFILWLCEKYGGENVDDGLDDVKAQSDMVGDNLTKGRMDLWTLLGYFLTFFLWEIELPIKYYAIWQHVKSLNDIRKHEEE